MFPGGTTYFNINHIIASHLKIEGVLFVATRPQKMKHLVRTELLILAMFRLTSLLSIALWQTPH